MPPLDGSTVHINDTGPTPKLFKCDKPHTLKMSLLDSIDNVAFTYTTLLCWVRISPNPNHN